VKGICGREYIFRPPLGPRFRGDGRIMPWTKAMRLKRGCVALLDSRDNCLISESE